MWNAKFRHSTKQPIKGENNKAVKKPDTEDFIFKTEQKCMSDLRSICCLFQLSTVPHSVYEGMLGFQGGDSVVVTSAGPSK